MTTAAQIIDRSMRLLGALEPGETSTDDEYANGLIAVNGMLGSWNNERLMCYALREESLSYTAAVSATIGPTGTLVTTRPVEVVQAWVVDGSNSYPVLMISDEEYGAIVDKASTSTWPTKANYKASMPDGTIYFYPVPSAAGTMSLLTRTPLVAFAAITDTVSLPPGWEDALTYNLAVRLAPEIQVPLPQEVLGLARAIKADLKRMNSKPMKAYTELANLVGRHSANILTDEP